MDEDTLREMYIQFLNECYGTFKIGSLEFNAADILEACDPIAFRCDMADYESFMMEEEDAD